MADMQAFEQECTQFFRPLWPGEDKILVFGDGNTDHPPLMLIGEAPGEQETLKRRPFVGKAGKNLDGFLELMGMERQEIYVSNVVKIRPDGAGRVRARAQPRAVQGGNCPFPAFFDEGNRSGRSPCPGDAGQRTPARADRG